MRSWNNDTRYCSNPEIIAGRLASIRNIYLRQELHTISNQIQKEYKDRLPALQLVSIAAYEQVFNRQVTCRTCLEVERFVRGNISPYLCRKNYDEMLCNMV